MTIAKPVSAALAAMASLTLLVLSGGSPRATPPATGDADPRARLTRPTLVTLDFKDRPIAEVVRAIGQRGGRAISAQGTMTKGFEGEKDPQWRQRRVTLEAPNPVPFWEAVERLGAAGRVGYRLGHYGSTGAEYTGVVFEESGGGAGGLVNYSGPFRVGLAGLHEHRDVVFIRGPWVRVYPSGSAAPADAADLGSAPPDGGPFYAELHVMAEPGLICRRDGPLAQLEAVDEQGRSLLAPPIEGKGKAHPWLSLFDRGVSPPLRIPLRRPEGPSRVLRRLRGVIPVEVATLDPKPALVIPLGGAEGRTVHGKGVTFFVAKDRINPDGKREVAISARLEGEMDPWLRSARITCLMTYQFRIVDARGQEPRLVSGSTGGDEGGGMSLSNVYAPDEVTGPPTEFRYFDLVRATWEIPFAFQDVPLP
jgi:hypothetical protein